MPMKINHPRIVNVYSWDSIEEHYNNLNKLGWGHDKMITLIKHIKSTGLSSRLFASTSLDKLIIGIYDPMEWDREALHIEFDRQNACWHFKYYPKPDEKIEFERKYDSQLGIEKFDSFIKMIKW